MDIHERPMLDRRSFLGLLAGAAMWPGTVAAGSDAIAEAGAYLNLLRIAIEPAFSEDLIANRRNIASLVYEVLPGKLEAGMAEFQRQIRWEWYSLDFAGDAADQAGLIMAMAQYLSPSIIRQIESSRQVNDGDFFGALLICTRWIDGEGDRLIKKLYSPPAEKSAEAIQVARAQLAAHIARYSVLMSYFTLLRLSQS